MIETGLYRNKKNHPGRKSGLFAVALLLFFTATISTTSHAGYEHEQRAAILSSVPDILTETGYIDPDQRSLIRKRAETVLSGLLVPVVAQSAVSFQIGMMSAALSNYVNPGASVPLTLIALSLWNHRDSFSGFLSSSVISWIQLGYILNGSPFALQRLGAAGFMMANMVWKGVRLLRPEYDIWANEKKDRLSTDNISALVQLSLGDTGQYGNTSDSTITITWQDNISQFLSSPSEPLLKLALSGQKHGYGGLQLVPVDFPESDLSLSYCWMQHGTCAEPSHELTLDDTANSFWWTTLASSPVGDIHGKSFADPLSPALIMNIMRSKDGVIASPEKEAWLLTAQQHENITLLSAPGHLSFWLYPGETSLFSLYRKTLDNIVVQNSALPEPVSLDNLSPYFSRPVFSGWGRLPWEILKSSAIVLGSLSARYHGHSIYRSATLPARANAVTESDNLYLRRENANLRQELDDTRAALTEHQPSASLPAALAQGPGHYQHLKAQSLGLINDLRESYIQHNRSYKNIAFEQDRPLTMPPLLAHVRNRQTVLERLTRTAGSDEYQGNEYMTAQRALAYLQDMESTLYNLTGMVYNHFKEDLTTETSRASP